jgi:hypothetical protein
VTTAEPVCESPAVTQGGALVGPEREIGPRPVPGAGAGVPVYVTSNMVDLKSWHGEESPYLDSPHVHTLVTQLLLGQWPLLSLRLVFS